jgi:very-short-patch-repair endonuclease
MTSGIVAGQGVGEEMRDRARGLRKSRTQAELLLWKRLRHHRQNGHQFRRQQVIAGYIVDFYCHSASLAIELDGPVHSSPEHVAYDIERDQILNAKGIRVLRFPNQTVLTNIEHALTAIQTALVLSAACPAASDSATPPPSPAGEGKGVGLPN